MYEIIHYDIPDNLSSISPKELSITPNQFAVINEIFNFRTHLYYYREIIIIIVAKQFFFSLTVKAKRAYPRWTSPF